MKEALSYISFLALILLLAASGCNGKDGTEEDTAEDRDADLTDFTETDGPGDPGEEDVAQDLLEDEPGEPTTDPRMDEIEEEGVEDVVGEDAVEEDPLEEDILDITEEDPAAEDLLEEGSEEEDAMEDDPAAEDILEEEIIITDCTGLPDFTPCVVITDPDRSYDICIDGECRSPGCGDATCNPPGPHFPLPDTNQRACYDDTGEIVCPGTPGDPSCATTAWCGQDAQYGWDTEHGASERFTRTSTDEPVVLDNVTGLEWQGCPAGQSGNTCGAGSASTMTWAEAVSHCEALTWGGHDDWHLPDRYELHSIVDYGRTSPAIDVTAFPGTPSTTFWSSSSYAGSLSGAWGVYFVNGSVSSNVKDRENAVRCARFGHPTVERFTRSGTDEPVVSDNVTGLAWQGCPAGQSGIDCSTGSETTASLQIALSFCEGLTWGGHQDWRLPDIKELTSIVDDHVVDPSIYTTAFPGTPSTSFWSSSSHAGSPPNAWGVSFNAGHVGGYGKGFGLAVRCVRVGP